MKAKELTFLENMASDRISQKINGLRNDLLFQELIRNDLITDYSNTKEKELSIYDYRITKAIEYLKLCNVDISSLLEEETRKVNDFIEETRKVNDFIEDKKRGF